MTDAPERRLDKVAGEVRLLAGAVNALAGSLEARQRDTMAAVADAAEARREVARLAHVLADLAPAPEEAPEEARRAPAWLAEFDAERAVERVDALVEWLELVHLNYRGADLTDCWLWHPEVVAELLTLAESWDLAFGDKGSPLAELEWHDRHRPGVVRRVGEYLTGCNLTRHVGDGAWRPVRAPGLAMRGTLARWWTEHVTESPSWPEPTAAMLADEVARMGEGL